MMSPLTDTTAAPQCTKSQLFLLKTLFFPKLTSSLIPFYALHPFEIHSCVSVWGVQKLLFFVFFSLSIHLT